MPDLNAAIVTEIHAGLRNERARLDDAMFNGEFYRGDFSRFPPRSPSAKYDSNRYPRHSLVMQRIVKVLTANLYARGPGRSLKAPDGGENPAYKAASEWLNGVYRANTIDAYWQEADRVACVGDFAAFQAVGTKDPKRPVRVLLWWANEVVVWLDPEDQLKPVAVATLDQFNEQRRLRLWTAETVTTFLTRQWNRLQPNGATAYYRDGEPEAHPYGVVPFSFVHFEFPCSYFHTNGPGTNLRAVNDGVNFGLTEGFDCIRYNLRPVVVLKNVRAGWRPPSPITPGDVWDLPAAGDGSEDDAKQDASYLQADSSFVAAGWDDIQAYLDHTLEMHGVPPATIRMTQDSARSGVSIIAEQAPLILWAESRQRPFTSYEDALAKLVLTVGAKHLGEQDFDEYKATSAQLLAVADEPGLVLRWPNMYPRIPGPERDQSDQWELDNKLTSRTMLLMERESLTREEAEARLDEVAEDLEREQGLFDVLTPEPLRAANGEPPVPDEPPADVPTDIEIDEETETDYVD